MTTDHFATLGLPIRFALDSAELERNYLERSRLVHPDHAGNDRASLERSAAVNEAYTVLRDPFRRAEYLLTLAGGPAAAAVTKPPPEFLEEMLDLRIQIEEAKNDSGVRLQLEQSLRARRNRLIDDAGRRLDQPDDADDRLNSVRQTLNAAKFIGGLLRDLNED